MAGKKEILVGSATLDSTEWAQDKNGKFGEIVGANEWAGKAEKLGAAGDSFDLASLFLQMCLVMGAVGLVIGSSPAEASVFLVAGFAGGARHLVCRYRMRWQHRQFDTTYQVFQVSGWLFQVSGHLFFNVNIKLSSKKFDSDTRVTVFFYFCICNFNNSHERSLHEFVSCSETGLHRRHFPVLQHSGFCTVAASNGSATAVIDFSSATRSSVGTNPGSAITGTGFSPNPATAGLLNSNAWAVAGWSNGNLAFGGTQTTVNTDYTRGSTAIAVTTGGTYAFTGAPHSVTNPCLMIQPGGSDWAPGTMSLKFRIQEQPISPLFLFLTICT
jgi:hypothetical protein